MKRLAMIALVSVTSVAFAQSPAPAPSTQQAAAQAYARRNEQLERAALQVAELVDQNQTAQVWEGASIIAKKLVSREAFVEQIRRDRQTVGAPVARSLASLSFSQSDGKRLPAGLFANVAFATRFAHEKQPVRELVSFHMDGDHVWRVSGYTLR